MSEHECHGCHEWQTWNIERRPAFARTLRPGKTPNVEVSKRDAAARERHLRGTLWLATTRSGKGNEGLVGRGRPPSTRDARAPRAGLGEYELKLEIVLHCYIVEPQ